MQRIRRIASANVGLFNENCKYLPQKAPLKLHSHRLAGSETEPAAVELQGLLRLPAVIVPMVDGDVLARTRQVVGDPGAILRIRHFEARVVAAGHRLRGVVVTEERETVVLTRAMAAVLEAVHAEGEQFVLAVGLVPVAHLDPQEILPILHFVQHEAVLLVDGERLARVQGLALTMPDPGLLDGVGRFVHLPLFFFVLCGLDGEVGPGEIADGRPVALIVHLDAALRRQRKRAEGEEDGQ